MHPTLWDFTRSPCAQPQARPTLQISFLTALHRRIIWSSSQLSVRRRPSLRSSSVSDRNHTPLSGALSQVCVLENVSHSCNHQHLSMALEGPSLFFFVRFVLSAVAVSITTGLGLHRRGLLLHEVIGPRYHGMCHI
jgi:hypothetical protein